VIDGYAGQRCRLHLGVLGSCCPEIKGCEGDYLTLSTAKEGRSFGLIWTFPGAFEVVDDSPVKRQNRVMKNCIIIGASHTGSQLCVSLRQGGYEGRITLIGDEADLPYHRPPLSKDFLSGHKGLEDILLRPGNVYDDANIDMKLGTRVGAIDRAAKTILTDDGETLSYDKLVLATGARVRHLPVPGVGDSGQPA